MWASHAYILEKPKPQLGRNFPQTERNFPQTSAIFFSARFGLQKILILIDPERCFRIMHAYASSCPLILNAWENLQIWFNWDTIAIS